MVQLSIEEIKQYIETLRALRVGATGVGAVAGALDQIRQTQLGPIALNSAVIACTPSGSTIIAHPLADGKYNVSIDFVPEEQAALAARGILFFVTTKETASLILEPTVTTLTQKLFDASLSKTISSINYGNPAAAQSEVIKFKQGLASSYGKAQAWGVAGWARQVGITFPDGTEGTLSLPSGQTLDVAYDRAYGLVGEK